MNMDIAVHFSYNHYQEIFAVSCALIKCINELECTCMSHHHLQCTCKLYRPILLAAYSSAALPSQDSQIWRLTKSSVVCSISVLQR